MEQYAAYIFYKKLFKHTILLFNSYISENKTSKFNCLTVTFGHLANMMHINWKGKKWYTSERQTSQFKLTVICTHIFTHG